MEKTLVMKLLDSKKIQYQSHFYDASSSTTGEEIASMLGQNPDQVFKTLVTVAKSGKNYVFVLPVNKELDLKKAAKSVKEKYVEMVKSKDLLELTGYIHGGCSPIGMKKNYLITFDETMQQYEKIMFSGGKIGCQIEINVLDIGKIICYRLDDLKKND